MNKEEIIKYINENFKQVKTAIIMQEDIVFEERVKLNCFYCGRYNNNWKCPPNIPNIDCQKMIQEYEHYLIVYVELPSNNEIANDVRRESSIMLHKVMLKLEKLLWKNNNSLALSLIGGSCKLCKNGCGKDKCNNPYEARSPVEAMGINIIESAKRCGIPITFPIKEKIVRIGMLLW